jgi:hypothetical protein
MATESLTFDITAHDLASRNFREVGRAALDASGKIGIAAASMKVFDDASARQGRAAATSTAAMKAHAAATKLLGDAEDVLSGKTDATTRVLNTQITALGKRVAAPTVEIKDKAFLLDMAKARAEFDRLSAMTADPSVTVDGLKSAELGLMRLDLMMDRLDAKRAELHVSTSLLARFLGGGGGGGGSGGGGPAGVLPAIFGLGGSGGAGAAGGLPMVAALVPAAAAATVALTALMPAIIGTGVALAGMTGFAAAAYPVVTNLITSLSGLRTATNAYQSASANLNIAIHKSPADLAAYRATIHGLEPDLQNAAKLLTNQNVTWQTLTPSMRKSVVALFNNSSAYKALLPDQKKALTALLAEKTAWENLSPAQQGIAKSMQALGGQFSKLETAIQPYVLTAFGTALKIVKDLMPAFRPLLIAAGKALDTFLGKMDSWLKSASGQKFIHWLETTGPKDIANLGQAFWDIMNIFGQVMKFLDDRGHYTISNLKNAWKFFTVTVPNIFTVIIPNAIQVGNDKIAILFDKLVILALGAAKGILDAFGHLPGPLGAPFRAASKVIGGEMDQWKAKAEGTSRSMQAAIDRIHGKAVTVTLTGVGGGKITVSSSVKNAAGYLEFHAAGGQIKGGIPGRDSVISALMPGEVVVPTHMVRSGAVDHLRGRLPGFAAGGFVSTANAIGSGVGVLGGKEHTFGLAMIQPFGKTLLANFQAALSAAVAVAKAAAAAAAKLIGGFGAAGPGGGSPAANAALARRMMPAWGSGYEWAAWNYVAMRESGWNQYARNPSSGAYGIPQALPPSKMGAAANPPQSNPRAQIAWMIGYIRGRYGDPAGAASHERVFNWYDRGGALPPGLSLAYNGTGRPEQVIPAGRGGVTVVLENRGVIGSQMELENWLVRSVDGLKRKGRWAG